MAAHRSLVVRRVRAVRRSQVLDSVVLLRLLVAVPRSQAVVRRLPADRKEIVGRRLIEVVAVRDLRTWMVVREVLVLKVVIVLADRGLRVEKQVAVQKVAVRRKLVVVRLAKALARNVAGLKADARKVTVRNVEHLSVAGLAGNLRAATPMWKP